MEGISGSGTGGGDMISEWLPEDEEGEVADVVGEVSSASSRTEKLEMGRQGAICGHGRSAIDLFGAMSRITGATGESSGTADSSDGSGFWPSITLGAFAGRDSEAEVEGFRFEPGGCSHCQ